MSRTALGATLALHGLLLIGLWAGLARPPLDGPARPRPPGVSVRLIATHAAPLPARQALAPPPQWQPILPAPLSLPALPAELAPPAAGPALLASADREPPAQPARDGAAEARPAPAVPALQVQASAQPAPVLVPPTLPPEHQACNARQVARHYPSLLRERGVEGRVVVRVKVDEEGRAAEVLIQTPSGWRLLDEAARQVAAACPYLPARRGEERLMAWIEYPVRFSLH